MIDLICPECHNKLNIPDDADRIQCSSCLKEYHKFGSAWDFRLTEKNTNPQWNADVFDASYSEALDGCEDGITHAEKQGIPGFLEKYRMSEVKERIAPWIISQGKESRVLDLGCGHGWYGCYLVEKEGFEGELYGVDVSPFNVNTYIRALKEKSIDNIHPFASTAETLPFADSSFDIVFSSEVLEHVHSPELFFKEAYRVLKPGGELIVTTPSGPICTFWDGVAWFPQKIKHLFLGKKSATEDSAYDIPMSWKVIRSHTASAGFAVKKYTKSVFLPHESYIQFFPRPFQYLLLWNAMILGALKPLTTCFGLHHIIRLEKSK